MRREPVERGNTRFTRRVLKEPLIQFFLVSALLFLAFSLKKSGKPDRPGQIVVSPGQIEALALGWERTWQRRPTRDELQKIIDEHIREEVYYREALTLGLERDDTIIRRRLRQKMEFLAEDFRQVDDTELQAFLASNPDRFREPAVLSFSHIYFNPDIRGEDAFLDARHVLAGLTTNTEHDKVTALGDPFIHQRIYDKSSVVDIARVFGQAFIPKLLTLPPGQWSEPIQSGFGIHLVLLTERVEGRIPDLKEIREKVLGEWQHEEQEKAKEAFYKRLREQYSVTIETPDWVNKDTH